MGSIVLLIFDCVMHRFYRFVDIWLCVAWVLLFCVYLVVYCVGLGGLLIFGCVLHGVCRVVDIWLCCRGFIGLFISGCVLHRFYRCVDI